MRLLISLGLISCFFSCSKELTYAGALQLTPTNQKELILRLDSLSKINPQNFYSKLSVDYSDTAQEISFKISVKIRTDSAINAIVSYMNFPVAMASISKDSLILVDKREKCFSKKSLDYFKELIGIDLDLRHLEELLMGKPLYFDSLRQVTLLTEPPFQVVRSTINRNNTENDIIIDYFFDPVANNISRIKITNQSDEITATINFLSRQLVKGLCIPLETDFIVETKQNTIKLRIRYEKVEINEPLELIFIIPEQYETCN